MGIEDSLLDSVKEFLADSDLLSFAGFLLLDFIIACVLGASYAEDVGYLSNSAHSSGHHSGGSVLQEQEDIIKKGNHSLKTKLDSLAEEAEKERKRYSEYPVMLPPDYIEEVKLDIDYWTKGKISELYAGFEGIFEPYKNMQGEISKTKVLEMIQEVKKAGKDMKTDLDYACEEAGIRFAQSRERRNFGRLIKERFTEKHGWRLKKGGQNGFLEKEPRNPVRLELVNPAGDQMTVDIIAREEEVIPVVSVRYATSKTISRDYQNVLQRNIETMFYKNDILLDSVIFT